MEASTIAAILVGSVVGGILSDVSLILALATCAVLYALAVIANFYIPRLVAARPGKGWHFKNYSLIFGQPAARCGQTKKAAFHWSELVCFGARVSLYASY